MSRAVTVMSRSVDESRHADRQFHSSHDSWRANFSAVPYRRPSVNVIQDQSTYEYPLTVPYMSHGCTPPCSMQIPNPVVSNEAMLSSNYPYLQCQSVLPDKQWYQKQEVFSTPSYALSTPSESKPLLSFEGATAPQVSFARLPSPPVVGGKSRTCVGESYDCGNAYTENFSEMPDVDPNKTLAESKPLSVEDTSVLQVSFASLPSPPVVGGKSNTCVGANYNFSESCSGMPAVNTSKMSFSADSVELVSSTVETVAVSANDGKVNAATPVSRMDTTVSTSPSASAVTPRPKCGRAKTNAELKRQLMERREQRLRDMLESGPESTVPCTSVASTSTCRQTGAIAAVVSTVAVF